MTRKDAIAYFKRHLDLYCVDGISREAEEMAIKALEQQDALDKIRAEIEQLISRYTISRERGGMGQVEWSDRLIKESEVMQIIDKYKESEVEE